VFVWSIPGLHSRVVSVQPDAKDSYRLEPHRLETPKTRSVAVGVMRYDHDPYTHASPRDESVLLAVVDRS
jgi:hypothetical protein